MNKEELLDHIWKMVRIAEIDGAESTSFLYWELKSILMEEKE